LDEADVAVVGAGVVGSATALALARRGASVTLLEAEAEPGLAASGTNSGILHTGFDSVPGELETQMILRSAALRDPLLAELGVPRARCGGLVRALRRGQRAEVSTLARNAQANGVEAELREDGSLRVPGESVTDPVAFTLALAGAAQRHGAELRTGFRVGSLRSRGGRTELAASDGARLDSRLVVNCAGLEADRVARMAGDDSFEVYARKGEFIVLEPPDGARLESILLPTPAKRTKGVLVFPTLDGKVVAGPTAIDQEDKADWSVRPEAAGEILPQARAMWEPLGAAHAIAAYAGLRPAGRGVNYLIGRSRASRSLVNVAAIRSTGLTASLGIAERVCAIVGELGLELEPEQPLRGGPPPAPRVPWWRRSAEYRGL